MEYSAASSVLVCVPPTPPATTPVPPMTLSTGFSYSPEPRKRGESLLEYGQKLHRSELQRLKMKHRAGMGGREVTLYRSELLDHLVREMHAESLANDATSHNNTA